MQSWERVYAVLEGKTPDRIPVDLWCTPEVLKSLYAHFDVDNEIDLFRQMDVDKLFWVAPPYRGPMRQATHPGETFDHWGIHRKAFQAGEAEYEEFLSYPLSECHTPEDIENYRWWPDPDQFDYEFIGNDVRRLKGEGFAALGPWMAVFEVYCWMRGLETALMDLATRPALIEAAFDRIESIQTELLKRTLKAADGDLRLVFISDDMGSQESMLISMKMWERYFPERLKRWTDIAHEHGAQVLYHSDGAILPLIPRLIECGVDVLNPIQHRCKGMELEGLVARFGDQLKFHGGVENQAVLPFGTPDDVRKETRHCLETLGKDRNNYICCSCHNIQAGTPVENILAMVETVHAY